MRSHDEEVKLNEVESDKPKIHKSKKCFTCKHPPDGGYSWVILVAGFILVFLVASTGSLFSLIFIHKIQALNMSSLSVALAFNFRAFMWNVASTMSGPLCEQFGWRKVGIAGALLCSLAVLCCCYATSVVTINIYFSFINGFGGGLAFSTCLFVLTNYFIRLKGFAIAIMGSGFGVGQFILPLFIRYLQEMYGFSGAAVIFSAILLNGVVAAALFHPLEMHQEKPSLRDTLEKQTETDLDSCELNVIESSSVRKTLHHFADILKTVLKLTYSNIVNLKSPVIAIISVSGACKIAAFLNIMLMLPISFLDKGLELQEAAYCISMTGTCMLIFRLITPILSDLKLMNATFFYIIGHLLVAVSSFVFTFLLKFSDLALCFGFFGAGIGISMGLQPIIFLDYKGLKELPRTYGSFGFVNAVVFLFVGTPLGYLRDATDSYDLMYRMFSAVLLFSAIIWIFMPCALSYEKKKRQRMEIIAE